MTASPNGDGGFPPQPGQAKRRFVRALIALAVALVVIIAAYFVGRSQGAQNAGPATVITETPPPETVTAAPTSTTTATTSRSTSSSTKSTPPPAPNGEIYLTDRTPVEGSSSVEVGSATVRYQEYPRSLLFSSTSSSVSYNIEPSMRTFRALIGMTDDSETCALAFDVKVDGTTVRRETVQVGQSVELMAPVGGGFRLSITADSGGSTCDATPVVMNPVLRPE
ncbi:NPCBM/NEW2 domain-containing protein [Saccharopolyspora taberi]|uniref:Glycosyl hydrolase family 98 putative carbohydrate-binding module domain-containing protein n=1 Tax=Saccharopolyspora taberi TaxID=60895 RepID=A0ABN3VC38_9PSEU